MPTLSSCTLSCLLVLAGLSAPSVSAQVISTWDQSTGLSGSSQAPDTAYSAAHLLHGTVWERRVPGGGKTAICYSLAGGPGYPVAIEVLEVSLVPVTQPPVICDLEEGHRFLIAWTTHDGTSSADTLHLRSFPADSTLVDFSQDLTLPNGAESLDVGGSEGGHALIAFTDGLGIVHSFNARPSGEEQGFELGTAFSYNQPSEHPGAVSVSHCGEYRVLAWTQFDGPGASGVWAVRVGAGGSPGIPRPILDRPDALEWRPGAAGRGTLGVSPSALYVMAEELEPGGARRLVVQRVRANSMTNLTLVGPSEYVMELPFDVGLAPASIGQVGPNRVLVAWNQEEGPWEAYGSILDATDLSFVEERFAVSHTERFGRVHVTDSVHTDFPAVAYTRDVSYFPGLATHIAIVSVP